MSVYVVARLEFTDEARYRVYMSRAGEIFRRHGVRLLAADEAPVHLEGDDAPDKVVIMAFPDEGAARAFLESEDYRSISADRRAGARTHALLVRGLPA